MSGYRSPDTPGTVIGAISKRVAKLELANARPRFLSIPDEESRSSPSFDVLATPDRFENVVVPANGLLYLAYVASWKESAANVARAALFVGDTQLHARSVPGVTLRETLITYAEASPAVNRFTPLQSDSTGLSSNQLPSGSSEYDGLDPATGVAVTTFAVWIATPGVYDLSIRYAATPSGTVTVKNRAFWVWGG